MAIGHDRCVNDAEAVRAVHVSTRVDDCAIVGRWADRTGPDDVGKE